MKQFPQRLWESWTVPFVWKSIKQANGLVPAQVD